MGKPIRTYAGHQNATISQMSTASSCTLSHQLSEREPSVASMQVEALTNCNPEEHLRVKQPPVLLTAAHLSVTKPSSYECPSPFPSPLPLPLTPRWPGRQPKETDGGTGQGNAKTIIQNEVKIKRREARLTINTE